MMHTGSRNTLALSSSLLPPASLRKPGFASCLFFLQNEYRVRIGLQRCVRRGSRPIWTRWIGGSRGELPEVDDDMGRAINEDTSEYIVFIVPKVFPSGTGDYHSDKAGLRRFLSFQEPGVYIMLWHDGRFMRHSWFRYWLLDTMLPVIVPGVQCTFYRTCNA